MMKDGSSWSFDYSKILASSDEPHLGYIALRHGVEHDLSQAVVTSGYRVTITYRLHSDDNSRALPAPLSSSQIVNDFAHLILLF